MAERRMFAKTIIDSDLFLDMPQSTQLLYFHLSMRADDDGFINNPKSIMRNVKCNEDDLKLLATKQFIIPFENGVVVIKHWRIHNYIKSDRYKSTPYQNEKSQLSLENNTYVLSGTMLEAKRIQSGTALEPCWNHNGTEVDTQSKSKASIGDSKDIYCAELASSSTPQPILHLTLNDKNQYPIYQSDIEQWQNLYPVVDVAQQLRAMSGWLDANPTRRKTRQGVKRFINNWLSKEQDRGGKNYASTTGANAIKNDNQSRGQAANFYEQFLGTGDSNQD